LRDIVFFYLCGIRKIIGAPLRKSERYSQADPATGKIEFETKRLMRCLSSLGEVDLEDRSFWDLRLRSDEIVEGLKAISSLEKRSFVAVNLGGKVASKDWGDANWQKLLQLMFKTYGHLGLVFFGSADEWDRCERMAEVWKGSVINLCGALTPRQAGAALRLANLFVGHDSGTMHLAAAVGVPCVCMFGNYNVPRRWHPYGPRHHVIHNMAGVTKISPEEVFAAVQVSLNVIEKAPISSKCDDLTTSAK
jgi:ADP-heptose:LPS heptosyltransferase